MSYKNNFYSIVSFLRWRLVPVRYLTMFGALKWRRLLQPPPRIYTSSVEIQLNGFAKGPSMPSEWLSLAKDIYDPRGRQVVPKASGHPFVNLFNDEDIDANNPVFRYAFSEGVLDRAVDYFGQRVILDSIQVLYSYPTEGALRESQYWHLDYGDSKSFHCVAYLNDVLASEDGPFVFVNKSTTDKIGRSLIVRRIHDQQFNQELNGGEIETFFAKAGGSVLVDPSACYHYGSRCKIPRLAIFVTFSTWFPFAQPTPLVTQNRQKILAAAQHVRPDLSVPFLRALLQLD